MHALGKEKPGGFHVEVCKPARFRQVRGSGSSEQGRAPSNCDAQPVRFVTRVAFPHVDPPEIDAADAFAHSMNVTFLTWCGNAGIGTPFRLTLGAHSQGQHCMADLHSRDELAEPLRQLGFVLARLMQRSFMPDSAKSGRFPAPLSKEEKHSSWYTGAESYLESLRRTNDILPEIEYPALEAPAEQVEVDPMDEEEADEDDEETDEVQGRAAEVHTDTAHTAPRRKTNHRKPRFRPKDARIII